MGHKFVITGGAGFIGSNLAEALAGENEVVIIDDLSTGKAENISSMDVRFIEGSITDPSLLRAAFEGADCVFHQAAIPSVQRSVEDPIRTGRVNIEGTLNVLVAARDAGVERVVYASSSSVYGDTPELPKSEDMCPSPKSPYAVAKLAGEAYCAVFNELYGMRTIALRYFNVYGPRQDPGSDYAAVIPRFVSALLRDEPPVIYGDGEQTRDFTYVKDVVCANILASRCDATGVFNAAGGMRISVNRLAELIGENLGKNVRPVYTDPRPGDVRDSLADIRRAKEMGYAPEFTIEGGLRETVRWFSANRG